jgi:hypothetical protein
MNETAQTPPAPSTSAPPSPPPAMSGPTPANYPTQVAPSAPAPAPAATPAPAPGFGAAPNAPVQQPTNFAATQFSPEIRAQLAELNQLRAEKSQYQPLLQMGYKTYQQEQQAAASKTAEANRNWFGLPAFNRDLLNFLEKDPVTGQVVAKAGAPPNAALDYHRYSEALQAKQQQFWDNPEALLEKKFEEIATRIADQRAEAQLGGYQQRQVADQLITSDASWIFANGSNGQGGLSEFGQYYASQVQQLASMGVTDSQTAHTLAKQLTQAAVLMREKQQAAAGTQQQVVAQGQQQNFLNNAGGRGTPATPPPTGGSQQPGAPGALPGGRQMSLREQLAAKFSANGINDSTLQTA